MKTRIAIAAGVMMLFDTGAALASPPSAITNSLVADVSATAEMLRITDETAISYAVGKRLHGFAVRDQAVQLQALDGIAAWREGLRRAEAAEAAAPTIDHLGPVIYSFNGAFRHEVPGARLTEADAVRLERLRALRAGDFDAAYVDMHVTALGHLLDLYTDYIRNGDDQELRALSVHQRPKILALLAQLGRR